SRRSGGRWGEKVPPAGGAGADRGVGGNGGPRWGQRAGRGAGRAGGAAGGAGRGGQGGRGAGGRGRAPADPRAGCSVAGGGCAALDRVEVHVEAGAILTEGAAGDDFAPAGGEVVELLQHLRCELAARHGLSCLVLA